MEIDQPVDNHGTGTDGRSGPQETTVGHNGNDDTRPMPGDFGGPNEHLGNRPRPTPTPDERPVPAAGQPNPRRRHGYAAVEVYAGAARVIHWEVEEDDGEPSPELSEQQLRLFRLGEWLSKQPISDQARAEYFDIERVSRTDE